MSVQPSDRAARWADLPVNNRWTHYAFVYDSIGTRTQSYSGFWVPRYAFFEVDVNGQLAHPPEEVFPNYVVPSHAFH